MTIYFPQSGPNGNSVDLESSANLPQLVKQPFSLLVQGFAFIIITLGVFGVFFSRFVLGVHALNQIIYGGLIGSWTCFYVIWVVDPQVREIITSVKANQISQSRREQLKKAGIFVGICALFIGIAVYLFVVYGLKGFDIDEAMKHRLSVCKQG